MKVFRKKRFTAQLIVWLMAQLLTLITSFVLLVVVHAADQQVSPTAFGLFNGATLLMTHRWTLIEIKNAFDAAVRARDIRLEGRPTRVTYVASTFPRRWMALLHMQLYPELYDPDFA
jgi:hypothetical protein